MSIPWKDLERRVAKALGGRRNPLSGRSSGHTSGDVIHHLFYVEAKYRQRWEVLSLFEGVREKAAGEGKVPILVLKAGRSPMLLVVMSLDDLVRHTEWTRPSPP